MSCSRLAAAALAVAALAFSGCGGSKNSADINGSSASAQTTSSTGPGGATDQSLTRAELVAKAGQICTHARGLISEMKATTQRALSSDLSQAATYAEAAVGELNRLKAEPALAPDFTKIVETLHKYAVEATQASERLAAKDEKGAREAFRSYKRANAVVVGLARRDGLSVCVTLQ